MTMKPVLTRGRPSDPAKRDAILEAARVLFFRGGPEGVNMEAVAREARVSKVTVYAHFADREGLLRAVIISQQERLVAALHEPVNDATGVTRSLTAFGRDLLNFFCSDDYLILDRMLAAQIHADPSLGRIVYDNGPLAVVRQLAELLEALQQRGLVRVDNSQIAAEQLIGMWIGTLRERVVMAGEKPDATELERRVEEGVTSFIRAFGAAESK